jgi:hypothetical protein
MTADHDPERSLAPPAGLFRAAGHVVVVRSGSALALLDLERGILFATTPDTAEAWQLLVDGLKAGAPVLATAVKELAALADYLLDRQLIEPRPADPPDGKGGDGGEESGAEKR